MAPTTKTPSKSAKESNGPGIKAFFSSSQLSGSGGAKASGSKPKIPPKAGSTSTKPIEIDLTDSESDAKPKAKSAPRPSISKPAPKKLSPATNDTVSMKSRVSTAPPTEDSDSDVDMQEARTAKLNKMKAAKRKSTVDSSDEEEEEERAPPKKKAATSSRPSNGGSAAAKPKPKPKPPAKSKAPTKKRKKDDDFIADDDEDEEEEEEEEEEKKPAPPKAKAAQNWAATKAAQMIKTSASSVIAGGSGSGGGGGGGKRSVPDGQPNCLAGLTFVFTGELPSLTREEAQDAAKRYGGRVTGAPSSKTSYVITGEGAGPKKLETIKKLGLETLDEDGFLNLIATRKGVLDKATKEKMKKDEEKVKKEAEEMEAREREEKKQAQKAGDSAKVQALGSQLWTSKYAPQNLKEICGNKGQVEKLNNWLAGWDKAHKDGFKKPGKDAMGTSRAVLLSGPPGIGKTSSAHLVAKLNGYTPIEVNASDARNKKLLENSTNITNRSLDGWLGGGHATNVAGVEIHGRPCLIMDEVDGMSGGDRGGVGALNALIKKTDIPIICIANDRNLPKMKPFQSTTFNLTFRRPTAQEIRSRMMSIAYKEKLKISAGAVDQLAAGSNADIRQVLNMMSTFKLIGNNMDFDDSKQMSAMNEKFSILTPFAVLEKIFGPYMFSPNSGKTLNDKADLYFHDFSLVPLMIQENYLRTTPKRTTGLAGAELALKTLELMDDAASAISDGDLVDAMIHSSEQHWSLMPLHAINSTVRPAYQVYGMSSAWGGPKAMAFPTWLGQNSKQSKLKRQLGDIQIRMRLKVTGDKEEIRQQYIPSLYPSLIKPLVDRGSDAVDDVIEVMDDYYLSKEEWDYLVELGVGDRSDETVLKKIPSATKTAFTRRYNSKDHPVAFHKASVFGKAKIAAGPAPDVEDAYDIDDEVPADVDDDADEDNEDVSKDKLIKQPKAKKATAKATAKAPAKPKAKPKAKA